MGFRKRRKQNFSDPETSEDESDDDSPSKEQVKSKQGEYSDSESSASDTGIYKHRNVIEKRRNIIEKRRNKDSSEGGSSNSEDSDSGGSSGSESDSDSDSGSSGCFGGKKAKKIKSSPENASESDSSGDDSTTLPQHGSRKHSHQGSPGSGKKFAKGGTESGKSHDKLPSLPSFESVMKDAKPLQSSSSTVTSLHGPSHSESYVKSAEEKNPELYEMPGESWHVPLTSVDVLEEDRKRLKKELLQDERVKRAKKLLLKS